MTRIATLVALLFALCGTTTFAAQLDPQPIRILTGADAWPWERVECYKDDDPHFIQETFDPDDADFTDNDIEAFGGDTTPHSKFVLFQYGKNWSQATQKVPVLLCPGAIRSASVILHDAHGNGTEGVAPYLIDQGYAVFAITYAYPSGENVMQAEQVANGIQLVKQVTGAKKIDLVTLSKGGVPVRVHLTDMPRDWRSPYRHDVRRTAFIGCPNNGLDGIFRHPLYAMALGYLFPWDYMVTKSGWTNTISKSVYNTNRYMGHLQLLKRWDNVYPVWNIEPDAQSTYYGGWGLRTHSPGIDTAIQLGGNFIDTLNQFGLHSDVSIAVLAGSKSYGSGNLYEYQGPSDMAVFVDSALATDAMAQNGAAVIEKETYYMNHGELLVHPLALNWLDDVLSRP